MSITATTTTNSKKFEPIEAGSYPARCYSMIEMGTNEENYQGTAKMVNKVRITWELPTEMQVFKEERGPEPRVISKEFSLSMHEKANLRGFLESWRGKSFTDNEAKAFDVTNLLGVPCLLSITHKTAANGNTYANISSVSLLPKGMECPEMINERQELSFDNFKEELFESLPDFIKEKIQTSQEYQSRNNETNNDLPF
tara:strand:- start:6376 stop:6969 length:594 start_codon:yes stop_codon:yes gene_type:complete